MKIFNKLHQISKAYVEGIYADTPANRKLGRVGMTYAAYAQKLKDEKEDKEPKKLFFATIPGGDTFSLTERAIPMTKNQILDKASKEVYDILKYNEDENQVIFDIEEDTSDWDNFDKGWESYRVQADRHDSYIDIKITDTSTLEGHNYEILRDDYQKRKNKNAEARQKYREKKFQKEYEENFGWMKELAKYKREKEYEIQNDDNVLNINWKGVGYVNSTKDLDSGIYYLNEIRINEEERGKGKAKLLLEDYIDKVKEDYKAKKIELQVESDEAKNLPLSKTKERKELNQNLVKNFYKKLGFKYQLEADKNEESPILELKIK